MVPLWAAVLGVIGTLVGVWLTQRATTKREANRDALRWAQERQQRELDSHKAAFTEALSALNRWFADATAMVMHLDDRTWPRPNQGNLPDLESAAANGLVAVELACSEEAIHVTQIAHGAVMNISFIARRALETKDQGEPVEFGLQSSVTERLHEASEAMKELRRVYRLELANLSAEPLATTGVTSSRRKRLTRKAGAQPS